MRANRQRTNSCASTASAGRAPDPSRSHVTESFIGQSPAIASVRDIALGIATRRSTVMILGETGSGKEMLARFIHERSERAAAPFVPVDCSTLTETLFESELF